MDTGVSSPDLSAVSLLFSFSDLISASVPDLLGNSSIVEWFTQRKVEVLFCLLNQKSF